jgi:hypothetical protein
MKVRAGSIAAEASPREPGGSGAPGSRGIALELGLVGGPILRLLVPLLVSLARFAALTGAVALFAGPAGVAPLTATASAAATTKLRSEPSRREASAKSAKAAAEAATGARGTGTSIVILIVIVISASTITVIIVAPLIAAFAARRLAELWSRSAESSRWSAKARAGASKARCGTLLAQSRQFAEHPVEFLLHPLQPLVDSFRTASISSVLAIGWAATCGPIASRLRAATFWTSSFWSASFWSASFEASSFRPARARASFSFATRACIPLAAFAPIASLALDELFALSTLRIWLIGVASRRQADCQSGGCRQCREVPPYLRSFHRVTLFLSVCAHNPSAGRRSSHATGSNHGKKLNGPDWPWTSRHPNERRDYVVLRPRSPDAWPHSVERKSMNLRWDAKFLSDSSYRRQPRFL